MDYPSFPAKDYEHLKNAGSASSRKLIDTYNTSLVGEQILFRLGNFMILQAMLAAEESETLPERMYLDIHQNGATLEQAAVIARMGRSRALKRYVFSLHHFEKVSPRESSLYGFSVKTRRQSQSKDAQRSLTLDVDQFVAKHASL